MSDLLTQYQNALLDRDQAYADYQSHLDRIEALEAELTALQGDLSEMEFRIPRCREIDEALTMRKKAAEARERVLVMEALIRTLRNEQGRKAAQISETSQRAQHYHAKILRAEYDRIAATIQPELQELFALASATKAENEIIGAPGSLRSAFSFLKLPDSGLLNEVAQRLGIPAQVPKAMRVG